MWSCESLTNIYIYIYTSTYCSSWFTYKRYFDQSIQFVQVKNTPIYTLHFDQKLVGLQLCFSFFCVFLCRKPFFLASEKKRQPLLYWTFCTAKEVLTVRTTLAANGCYGDGHSGGCGMPIWMAFRLTKRAFGKLWEARRWTFQMFSEVTEVSKHSTERPGMAVTKPMWISTTRNGTSHNDGYNNLQQKKGGFNK